MTTPYQIVPFHSLTQSLKGWLAVTTIYNTDTDVVDSIKTIGHTFMHEEPLNKLKFLDAWVHPDYRRQGIFRSLWDTRWEHVQFEYPNHTVYAWCLPVSLPLLIEKGFSEGDVCTYVERKVTADVSYEHPDIPITC